MSELHLTPEEIDALIADRDRLAAENAALAAGVDAERSRADELDGRVRKTDTQLAEAAVGQAAQNIAQADAAIRACDAELEQLQRDHVRLQEEGNFTEASKIAVQIGDATARRNNARQSKTWFENQHNQLKAQPTDPVERFLVANPDFSEAEQAWIRKNPRYATDRSFRQRVEAAHVVALDRGMARGGEEYFKHIEDAGYLRPAAIIPRQGEGADEGGESPFSSAATETDRSMERQTQPPRRAPASAAPPSRRSPTASDTRREVGRLNADQMEMAMRMYDLTAPEGVEATPAAIGAWWLELNNGPAATRKREEWAQL